MNIELLYAGADPVREDWTLFRVKSGDTEVQWETRGRLPDNWAKIQITLIRMLDVKGAFCCQWPTAKKSKLAMGIYADVQKMVEPFKTPECKTYSYAELHYMSKTRSKKARVVEDEDVAYAEE